MLRANILLFLLICSVTALIGSPKLSVDSRLTEVFAKRNLVGVFVAFDARSGGWLTSNVERANQAFLPASTFKIPNSLISLECGAVADVETLIKWDGKDRGFPSWNHDQNMREALKNSTVWFYQELARRVGEERMRSWVSKFEYGNADISGGIDVFWLQGNLRITAVQQIEFLQRLRDEKLPCSKDNMAVVKEIMIADRRDGWILRAKTGTVIRVANPVAWYVGWIETAKGPVYFALNFDIKTMGEAQPRLNIAYESLVALEALPEGTKPAK